MSEIKLGCHVGMAGKEMFLASAKEAASYGANVFMLYTGAPQNTRRKEISELNIDAGWEYILVWDCRMRCLEQRGPPCIGNYTCRYHMQVQFR